MPAELRLAVRLFRGSHGRDLVRYLTTIVAVASITVAVAFGLGVALLGTHEAEVTAARAPVRADVRTGLWLAESTQTLDGRQWTRVIVSTSVTRTDPPAGLASWPTPGGTAVSPALAELLSRPEYSGSAKPIEQALILGPAGVTSPSELYSYTVLEPDAALGASYREILGFGRGVRPRDDGNVLAMLAAVALILAIPAAMFFHSALRFLLASRERRFGILVRIGIPRRRIARLFAAECALVTATAVTVGCLTYAATQAAVGSSGLLAVTWWPASGQLPVSMLAGIGLLATVAAWRRGGRMIRTTGQGHIANPPIQGQRSPRCARSLVIVATGYLAGLVVFWLATPPTLRQPGVLTVSVLVAVAAGTIGLARDAPRWSRSAALRLARGDVLPSLRFGLRGAAHFAAASGRFLIALVLLSVVSGVASGFIAGVARWGVGYASAQILEVDDFGSLDPGVRTRLTSELKAPFVVLGYTDSTAVVVIGDCAGVTAFDRLARAHPGGCMEGRIQTGDELGLASTSVRSVSLGPTTAALSIPTEAPVHDVRWSVKLPASFLTPAGGLDGASLIVPLTDAPTALAVTSFMARTFPQVPVQAGIKDPDSYDISLRYSSLLRIAFGAAVIVTAAALCFLSLEVAWSRTRQTGSLAAIGLGRLPLGTQPRPGPDGR